MFSNYSSNPSIKTNYLLKRNVAAQNIINFTNDLSAYDWSTMKGNSDIIKAFNIFLYTFSNLNAIKKKLYQDSLTLKNTVSIYRYKRYINKVNAIIRRQKNAAYKQFCCDNICSDMWVKNKKLTDHTKYNTVLDDIFYGNNTFSKCERINAFNKFFFSSIATDLQDTYLPIVNSENRSTHERYLKNPQKNTFYFSPISANDILIAIGDCKSKSSLDFSNIDMDIINIF